MDLQLAKSFSFQQRSGTGCPFCSSHSNPSNFYAYAYVYRATDDQDPDSIKVMPALSAPATRTSFQIPRRPRATPRITVLRKPSQILDSVIVEQCESEEEDEDGAQYATFPILRENNADSVLDIGAVRERQEKKRDTIFENKVLQKLERRKVLAGSGETEQSRKIGLAKAAATGSLRERGGHGHRSTQSLSQTHLSDPFTPASPPNSPPVFNFSSLTSPTPFTSAVSPDPTMANFSHNPLYNYLVSQNLLMAQLINSLPPVDKPKHTQRKLPVNTVPPYSVSQSHIPPFLTAPTLVATKPGPLPTVAPPQTTARAHRRTGSTPNGGGSLSSLPSLDQIAAHLNKADRKTSPIQINPTVSISKIEPDESSSREKEKGMTEFLKRRTRERNSGTFCFEEGGKLGYAKEKTEDDKDDKDDNKTPTNSTLRPRPLSFVSNTSEAGRSVAGKRMVNTLLSGRKNRFSMIEGITC